MIELVLVKVHYLRNLHACCCLSDDCCAPCFLGPEVNSLQTRSLDVLTPLFNQGSSSMNSVADNVASAVEAKTAFAFGFLLLLTR